MGLSKRLLVLAMCFAGAGVPAADGPSQPAEIEGIMAQLYYHSTGGFSGDVIDTDTVNLFNVNTGRGNPALRSRDLFVRVAVRFPNGTIARYRLTLAAIEGDSARIFEQSVQFPYFESDQRFTAPFWIHDVGCGGAVVLSASLRGPEADQVVRRMVPFECGE